MAKSPLFQKLQSIAGEFSCGVWGSPEVLSPQRHVEKAEADFDVQPGPITAARIEQARGKWALIFQRPAGLNARGGAGSRTIDAIVAFDPEDVTSMNAHEIRKVMIGVIAEREFHEVLEWAQLRPKPGVPIVDPHVRSDDLITWWSESPEH